MDNCSSGMIEEVIVGSGFCLSGVAVLVAVVVLVAFGVSVGV